MSGVPERRDESDSTLPAAPREELERMGLFDHLEELRHRLVRALIAVFAAFLLCWTFAEEIYAFLARPIEKLLPEGTRLVFTGVADPFMLYVKVAALAGIFLASPVVLYQAWRFITPGLYRREKHFAVPFVLFGTFFFLAGGAFGYYIAFPFAVEFLLGVGEQFQPMITIERYFRFLLTVILGLGVMFELPIVIFMLCRIGVATPRFFLRHFRYAVLLIFIAAAILTPTPDVVNLSLFALPTIFLYLLGIGAAAIAAPRQGAE